MTSAIERDATTTGGANGSPQGQQLQDAAAGLMEQAARTADAQASTTMTRVGETLETVAGHIRQAGQELQADQPQVSELIDSTARRIEGAAAYLRDHDASEAVDSLQRAARNQPALVIAGGLAAGLLIGRILRGGAETAAPRSEMPEQTSPGGSGALVDEGPVPDSATRGSRGRATAARTTRTGS
jgi:hypothetical protein